MQETIDYWLGVYPQTVTVSIAAWYTAPVDLRGRARASNDENIVEYIDADGNELLRHTIPG
jgi:hypothetical protein